MTDPTPPPGLRMDWPDNITTVAGRGLYSTWRNLAGRGELALRIAAIEAEARAGLDVDGIVAELMGVEAHIDNARERLIKATNTLGGIARAAYGGREAPADEAVRLLRELVAATEEANIGQTHAAWVRANDALTAGSRFLAAQGASDEVEG